MLTPACAAADGPVAPVATSYIAKLAHVPAGLRARIVDGYLRLWLSVPARENVVVLDYRGAPYLRFSRLGVEVNTHSEMYYLNATPVAEQVPPGLRRTTPPRWQRLTSGHSYEWHDGRLNGLAAVALAPGQSYVGKWTIALTVNGRLEAIAGGLWHAPPPSLVWFWAVFVILACTIAGWRVRTSQLDQLLARALAIPALIGLAVAALALQLHGRPTVPRGQYVELAAIVAFALWALHRVLLARPGYLTYFVIAFVAFWEGVELAQSLLSPFVLLAVSASLTRAAAVLCLGCGAALALVAFRLAGAGDEDDEQLDRAGTRRRITERFRGAYSGP
ncbi:MAG: hypothetical protein ABSC56_00160 [Solirubrobacteraceae bacterium]|jgi:hypothetical protein